MNTITNSITSINHDGLENKADQTYAAYDMSDLSLDDLLADVELDSELRVAVHRT